MNSSFINQLADHIKETYDLRKQELTIIFPNKRAAFYLRTRFQQIYEESIWLPQMLSVEEAMTEWSGISLVDSIDMLFELIAIDSELKPEGGDLSVFGGMAAQMAKDFDEIDQYAVDAQHLFSYVEDEKRIGVWNLGESMTIQERAYLHFFESLKEYYTRLRCRLENQGKGYYGMITRYLAEMSDDELVKRVGGRKVIFAGFNALTPTEQRIIDKLYKSGLAEVIWDFDRYYVEDERNEAGYFARSYIKKNLQWQPTTFTNSLLSDSREIHMVAVAGNTIQAKALQNFLQSENVPDTSIILADENLLIPVLNSIPEDENYSSIKVSMGYPLRQTSLTHLIDVFFDFRKESRKIGNDGWYIWPIYNTFDLEITRIIFQKDELERLDSFRRKSQRKSLFIFKEEDFKQSCPSADVQRFLTLLLGLGHDEEQQPLAVLETLTALLSFIANKLQQSENVDDKLFLLNQISMMGMALNRLKDIIQRYNDYVKDVADLEILFRLIANNLSIKLNSSSTTGLQVMGLLEARNLDFDSFYMIGVNEGVLPTGKPKGSFIPYYIRIECGLPGYEEKQSVYAYHFYRLLQGSRKVYYLYNSSSKDSAAEPSRFLLQLKYELVQRNPSIKFVEETFNAQPEPDRGIPALFVDKDEDVLARLVQKLTADPSRALAPTSLSTYITCPLQFYLHYLMRIDDDSVEERTQSNVIGTVLHDTLQHLYEDYLNVEMTKELFEKRIVPSLPDKLHQAIFDSFGQGLPDVGYNYLDHVTIDELLKSYMDFELNDIKNHKMTVMGVEKILTTTLTVDGIPCVIAGKADRIDCHDGIIRIVDYKTGKVDDRDVTVSDRLESLYDAPEKAIQLLTYKYLYLKEHPECHPSQVTASLFALRYGKVVFDLDIKYQPLLDDFMGTMDEFFMVLLHEMQDKEIPFSQLLDMGPNNQSCKRCAYFKICSNTSEEDIQEDDH